MTVAVLQYCLKHKKRVKTIVIFFYHLNVSFIPHFQKSGQKRVIYQENFESLHTLVCTFLGAFTMKSCLFFAGRPPKANKTDRCEAEYLRNILIFFSSVLDIKVITWPDMCTTILYSKNHMVDDRRVMY